MKNMLIWVYFIVLLFAFPAFCQERKALPEAVMVITKKPEIRFYSDSLGENTAFSLGVRDIKLPLQVLEERDDFIKLRINSGTYWARSSNFKLKRNCSESMASLSSQSSLVDVSASRGAGNGNGCSRQ